jgi:malonate transporter
MIDILGQALIPIFFVIALGYWAGASGKINNQHVAALNSLVMDFALPAAMVGAITQASPAELIGQWQLVVIIAASLIILWFVVYLLQRKVFALSPGASAIVAMTVALPNAAATSIPLMTAVFGPSGRIEAVVGIVIGSVVLSPLTLTILEFHRAKQPDAVRSPNHEILAAVYRAALSPLILVPLIAIVATLAGFKVPSAIDQAFALLGDAASPVALLLTGIVLSAQRPAWTLKIAIAVIVANLGHPVLSWALAELLSAPPPVAHAGVLLTALPSGFFGILFALRYREQVTEGASIVAISTIFSMVTLTLAIAITAHMR